MYHANFDPEGIVSSLGAIASLWIGAFVAHVLLDTRNKQGGGDRFVQLGGLAVPLLVAGIVLHLSSAVPMNKCLYSISYMLTTSGAAIGAWCRFNQAICVLRRLSLICWPLMLHSVPRAVCTAD